MTDTIDTVLGIAPGDALDALRRRRPVTREQLQASHDALFSPVDDAAFPIAERHLVAAFATRLTADDALAAYYADHAPAALRDVVLAEAVASSAEGPFGHYREAGLVAESTDGPRYETIAHEALSERLAAALTHAHLLVFRPREADADALDRLLDAGWSVDGIVTLSQLVAFVAFQQRVAAGLTALARAGVRSIETEVAA
ncbi:CMD domain protein [Microbacterium candidum]|uniref:CMD domain protein n=1 Tax=Microbacterium candidum TaxID=3041922 RepID=A0ABT7MWK1_9MICO|nr:CMD domain protein [Microbacterium sp. ASV49]MDL9978829.1 CMD domain protein [Microbacterium sp. ASV49]